MTDGASHNLKVDEMVAMDFEVELVPQHLFCHKHPCLMGNRKFVAVIMKIGHQLGWHKIYSSF